MWIKFCLRVASSCHHQERVYVAFITFIFFYQFKLLLHIMKIISKLLSEKNLQMVTVYVKMYNRVANIIFFTKSE